MKQYTTEIFSICDSLLKAFSKQIDAHSLRSSTPGNLSPTTHLSLPELMPLLIVFHFIGQHDFKHFYHHAEVLF